MKDKFTVLTNFEKNYSLIASSHKNTSNDSVIVIDTIK